MNASIALNWDNYRIEAYATNLTKEYYVSGQFGSNEFYGAPHEFGVRVGARF